MNDWLSHRVAASPEAPALVRAETGETWDYADMDAEVEETARRLASFGVGPGDHLGMVLPTSVAAVRVVHAALRLGATLVPLGDRLTAPELAVRVERADVSAVVCDATTAGRVAEAAGDAPVISVAELREGEDGSGDEIGGEDGDGGSDGEGTSVAHLLDLDPAPVEPADWRPADVQLILFTSGTTGNPKAVQLTLGNLLASAGSSMLRLGHDPADRWLVTLSLHHMGGIGPVLRAPLYGISVVLREEFDAGGVVDDIDRHDVTAISLVPTMLQRMFESRGTLPGSLRVVLLGGAPAPTGLIERCRDYSVPVYPTYGMTETASQIATARPREAFDHLDTVGRPLFGTEVAVVADDGEPLPPGEVGELVVSGPIVSPGYYGDPEATAGAFGPHGLRTGDVGYRDEAGRLYVLNRTDDRIITGGENVDPGEVVDALREHPRVTDAAVTGLPDEEWGERVAALVVRDAEGLTRDSIESHCRERLAGFKLPRTIAFAEELPRTVSGTVDREAVRERLLVAFEGRAGEPVERRDVGGPDEEAPAADETEAADEGSAEDESAADPAVGETDSCDAADAGAETANDEADEDEPVRASADDPDSSGREGDEGTDTESDGGTPDAVGFGFGSDSADRTEGGAPSDGRERSAVGSESAVEGEPTDGDARPEGETDDPPEEDRVERDSPDAPTAESSGEKPTRSADGPDDRK